jgi:hypothetical protein
MSIYWSIPCYDGIWAQEFKPDLTRSEKTLDLFKLSNNIKKKGILMKRTPMRKIISTVCVALLAAVAYAEEGIKLAVGNKPLVSIVVHSDGAIPAEKTAAKELSNYLKKITGVDFAPVEEKEFEGGPAIYVGWTEFAKKKAIDFSSFGEEQSMHYTAGQSLIVGGGRPRGTIYAAYELLEKELGVRWLTPTVE